MIPIEHRRIEAAYEHFVELIEEQGDVSLAQARRYLRGFDKYERLGLSKAIRVLFPAKSH